MNLRLAICVRDRMIIECCGDDTKVSNQQLSRPQLWKIYIV